jgi:hypothetical protein
MDISVFEQRGRVSVIVLQPHGDLDSSTYRDLMTKVREIYEAGARDILLDLSDTPHISYSGIVALHNIAAMLRGDRLTEPDSGFDTIYAITEDPGCGFQKHVKLLNPQSEVDQMLELEWYNRFLEIYTDREAAIASF